MPVIYGYRSVLEALRKNSSTHKLYITKNKLQECESEKVICNYENIHVKDAKEMHTLCATNHHNGIALEVSSFCHFKSLSELGDRIIILAHITDTGNLGAIIRTAAILEYDVILSKNNSAPINSVVAKNAAGGLEYVNIHMCNSLLQTIKQLKKNYYFVVGATEHNNSCTSINLNNKPRKICLVMGGEQTGIPYAIQNELDFTYTIKGRKDFNVYNVSVAAALCMGFLSDI